jgi:hypothetical protein
VGVLVLLLPFREIVFLSGALGMMLGLLLPAGEASLVLVLILVRRWTAVRFGGRLRVRMIILTLTCHRGPPFRAVVPLQFGLVSTQPGRERRR